MGRARAPRRGSWIAAVSMAALVLGGCGASEGHGGLAPAAWGTMGHGARQAQRGADGLRWSLAVRSPDVLLEVARRRLVVEGVLARGVLRYAVMDEIRPHIWMELPDGTQLDWDGLHLASADAAWRMEREGRYALRLGDDEPLVWLGES